MLEEGIDVAHGCGAVAHPAASYAAIEQLDDADAGIIAVQRGLAVVLDDAGLAHKTTCESRKGQAQTVS